MFYRSTLIFSLCALITVGKNPDLERQSNVRDLVEAKVNDFKLRLHSLLNKTTELRKSLNQGDTKDLPVITSRSVELGIEQFIMQGCATTIAGSEVVFFISSENTLLMLRNRDVVSVFGFPQNEEFISLQCFGYDSGVWLITHIIYREKHFIKIFPFNPKELSLFFAERIDLLGPSIVSAAKHGDAMYIAVTTTNSVFSEFKLFRWLEGQLIKMFSTGLSNSCSALAAWEMKGSIYVAMSFGEVGNSQIKRFTEGSEKMRNFQLLDVAVHVIKHLKWVGNHYVIFGTRDSVLIHRWTGSAFFVEYSEPFDNAIKDIATIALSEKAFIAVVLTDRVKFFMLDGSTEFTAVGSVNFSPTNKLRSILLWRNETFLYMLPLFTTNRAASMQEISIKFIPERMKQPESMECLNLLSNIVEKRKKELDKASKIVKKILPSPKQVKAGSSTANGKVKSLTNTTMNRWITKNNISLISMLKKAKEMTNDTNLLKDELKSSISRSSVQFIKSKLKFKTLTVSKGVLVGLESHLNLNTINTTRLPLALKKNGNQTFAANKNVSAISCGNATITSLNGNRMENYVQLKSGFCNVTGLFKFSDVSVRSMVINSSRINGVSMEKLVLGSNTQDVQGSKKFASLSAKSVWTKDGVNEIKNVQEKIESLRTWNSPLNFSSVLNIRGNLTVKKLNDLNILNLDLKSVKRTGKQNICSKKIFKSLMLNGNLAVNGKINERALDNLMTRNTDQKIYGGLKLNGVTNFQEILTDSLNGIDLSEQAVLRSRDSKIEGVVIFNRILTASTILLGDGVLIDSFDPSVGASEVVCKSTNTRPVNSYEFGKDVTVGKIVAKDLTLEANSFPLLSNLNNVWLRRTVQNIPSLEVKRLKVKELEVSKVNGISMEDLVTAHGNENITGFIKFDYDVSAKTVTLSKESKFNFFPDLSNPNQKVKIKNNVTLENVTLEGNLITQGIEGIETDFMLVEKFQILKDEVAFDEVMMKELHSRDLKLQFLNSMNITNFLENSVLPFTNRSISNKHFKALKGTRMVINGTLNNVTLARVATTNTDQTISSSWKFGKMISLSEICVNNFFGGVKLEDIIYIDEVGIISQKKFNGNVSVPRINTGGYISGVNVTDLYLKAFKKSTKNIVEKRIQFASSLKAEEMQIKGSTIDEVDLSNLIQLNEPARLEKMNITSIIAMNVTMKGPVNGCPWMSILENALLRREIAQNVTSRIAVNSLMIEGNLRMEYLNGSRIPHWISLLSLLASPDFVGDLVFGDLKADSIQIARYANDESLKFLMNDAVRKSVHQVISSKKRFRKVSAAKVNATAMESEIACGVNMTDFFEEFPQRIFQNGTFLNVGSFRGLVSKQITIKGHLNSLKVPDDVVLVNTTDVFRNQVVINNTVNATIGIMVSGNINGYNLEEFLEKRITLNTSQTIFSALNFTEDFKNEGNMLINGTINGINITDIAKRMLGNQTVSGTKTFVKQLQASNLIVNGSVNDVFFDQFLKISGNESVKHIEFSRLNVSSLTCGAINGLDVIDFYDHTHNDSHYVNDKLHNFTEDILSYQDSLRTHKDFIDQHLSIFNYFELQEMLDFGVVKRFLPIYEFGTYGEKYELHVTQMVMWIKTNRPCRKTKSLIADVLQNGTFNVTKKLQGQIFPFSLTEERDDVVGFYVQAEHSGKCSPGREKRLLVKTKYSSGSIEKGTIAYPQNATLMDVRLLELHDLFLLTAYNIDGDSDRIFVYQYGATNNTWSLYQSFHAWNLTSLDIVSVERNAVLFFDPSIVYLSITGSSQNPGVTVYEWDFEMDEFFITTNMSTSVSSYAVWFDYGNSLHLLLAKELTKVKKDTTWVNVYNEHLEVYTLEEEELILNHTVNVKGVCSLERFILAEEAYALASSNHMETVYILKFRGFNGFEVIQEIPAPGVTEALVFTVDHQLYLALNSRTGQSRILKASVRRERLDLGTK